MAYLDRVNVSFAQLQLEDDLGFSDTIFGLGAGVFSLGYVAFGMPSNLILERVGARRWLSAIMITWGLISASMMFMSSAESFYIMRFLLGVAEAGFFPGIVLYLTWWFPEADRGRTLALFMTAISASYVAGGPISGGLLELDGLAGLDGWQWLFLCEGLPAVMLGFVALRFLDDRPSEAAWLEEEERTALSARIEEEQQAKAGEGVGSRVRDALGSGQVWLCSIVYFILLSVGFGLTFFVPDLVQDRTGLGDFQVGALSALPYAVATVAMVVLARKADESDRKRMYVIALGLVGVAGTVLTAYAQSVPLLLVSLTLSTVGLLAVIPIFWSLPTGLLAGSGAAAGIGVVAAIGNLGGFVGPSYTGAAEDATGDFVRPFLVLAGLLVVGCLLTLRLREPGTPEPVREPKLPHLFKEQPFALQIILGFVVPALLGTACGFVLGWSSPGYWAFQVVALTGGFVAGMEHRGGWEGADRGAFGGVIFGSFILLAHAIHGAHPHVHLGEWPGTLPVFTGLFGAIAGGLGGRRRAKKERQWAEVEQEAKPERARRPARPGEPVSA